MKAMEIGLQMEHWEANRSKIEALARGIAHLQL